MKQFISVTGTWMAAVVMVTTVILMTMLSAKAQEKDSFVPKNGFVPREDTAISIAVAVWIPIVGKEAVDNQKPYVARLNGEVWTVKGTLPRDTTGGPMVAEISKKNGCIIRVTFAK